jgi:hypothetical protein
LIPLPLLAAAIVAVLGAATLGALLIMKAAVYISVLTVAGLALFGFCIRRDLLITHGKTALGVALAMPVAAWLLPNIWLLFAAMIALVPLAARRPEQIVGVYLFSLLLLPGLDLTVVLGSLKLCEFGVQDGLAVGAALAVVQRGKARRVAFGALDVPFALVMLLLVTAVARDTSATNFLRVLMNGVLDFGLPYFIISRGLHTVEDGRLALVWLAAAAAILSVILTYEARGSWPLYNILYDHYGIPTQLLVKSRGGVMRAGGPFVESTSMAMVLVFCLFATLASRPAFRSAMHYRTIVALQLLGLVAPQSRGAWIGLLLGIALMDLVRRRYGMLARRGAIVAVTMAGLVGVAQISPFVSESLGLSGGSVESADYRKRLLTRGLEEFWRSPITGYPSPEILQRLADLRQGEGIIDFVNTYIYVMLVSGAVGLAIFLFAFGFYLRCSWAARGPMHRVGGTELAAFTVAGVATPMEMLFFTSFGGRPAMFVFIFFAFAAFVARKAQAAAPVRAPAAGFKPAPVEALTIKP